MAEIIGLALIAFMGLVLLIVGWFLYSLWKFRFIGSFTLGVVAPPASSPINIPTAAVWGLGIVGGVLTGSLRSHALDVFGLPADNYVGVALAVVTSFVGPFLGPSFRNAVHLKPWIVSVIGVVLLIAQTLLVQVHGTELSAILMALITFFATIGFGPGQVVVSATKAALA